MVTSHDTFRWYASTPSFALTADHKSGAGSGLHYLKIIHECVLLYAPQGAFKLP